MRILYLNYGPQSGVVPAVTRELQRREIELEHFDPMGPTLYSGRRRFGLPMPNPRPFVLRGIASAIRRHGDRWKAYYLHTCCAFDRMTHLAGEAVRRSRADLVLQAGALFQPGRYPTRPYALYLDNTRAIAERYPCFPHLLPPIAYEEAWRARERSVYRGATAIFTMSQSVACSLADDYGVQSSLVHVVGAGPNVVPRPPEGIACGSDDRARTKAFLFVGIAFAEKGGDVLLSAFSAVRRRHPDAKLWVVGGHRPGGPIPGTTFFGRLGPRELGDLYTRAYAFVLPTLREPFGLSYLEAMAFALPCIGPRAYAVPEIIADGESGLLVPLGEPGPLAAAMQALLDQPTKAAAMGAAGRARVTTHFGWSRTVGRMVDILEERVAPGVTPAVSPLWPSGSRGTDEGQAMQG